MSERDLPRIGRKRTPGEGTIALMRERPEVLEFMAMTEWANENGILGIDMEEGWKALPSDERAQRIDDAFASASASARAYDATLGPDDPGPSGGGEPHPIPAEKIA